MSGRILCQGLCAWSMVAGALLPLLAHARLLAGVPDAVGRRLHAAQVGKPAIFTPLRRRTDDRHGEDASGGKGPWAKQRRPSRALKAAEVLKGPVSISKRQMTALRASSWAAQPSRWGSMAVGRVAPSLGAPASAREDHGGEVAPPRGVSRLRDLFSTEYAGPLGVGNLLGFAEAELSVVFDTGSSDLWVASDLCFSRPCSRQGRNHFDHHRSETFRAAQGDGTVRTTYASGMLVGKLGFDTVRVGSLVVEDQEIGLVSEERGSAFETLPLEGIVGLGFPGLALEPNMSLFDNLAAQSDLERLQFAFYLHHDPSLGGGVLWGGVDHRLYSGTLQWFPVVEQLYWALDLVAFEVGHTVFDFADEAPPRLIVDTGTTFFTAEGSIQRAFAEQVSALRCSQVSVLPPLVYTLRDVLGALHRLTIQPEQYMVHNRGLGGEDDLCLPAVVSIGASTEGGRPTMILGEVFVRHFFTVFHRGRALRDDGAAVGFAPARYDQESEAFFVDMAARV